MPLNVGKHVQPTHQNNFTHVHNVLSIDLLNIMSTSF
jgi:hypothetical protein